MYGTLIDCAQQARGGPRLSALSGSTLSHPAKSAPPRSRLARRRAAGPRAAWSPRTRRRLAADAALLVVAAAFVLPLAWLILASVDGEATLRVSAPGSPTLDNFQAVWTDEITFTPM